MSEQSEHTIVVASHFSWAPVGRFKKHGPYSGEAFRDDYLVPALRKYDKVTVDINDILSFGSSFVDEAFGGLVRKYEFTESDLKLRLNIVGNTASERMRFWQYIAEAQEAKQKRN